MQIQIHTLPKSELEIEGSIEASDFDEFYKTSLKKLQDVTELEGFRKGHAPEGVLLAKLGNMAVLEQAAELALNDRYPKILKEKKIDAIGKPFISIVKLARGNPFEFKIRTAVFPELTLPDYKKIAQERNKTYTEDADLRVEDSEISGVLQTLQKQKIGKQPNEEVKKEELPALDDELAKYFGADTLPALKEKIKENILTDKKRREREKKRLALIEELLKVTEAEIPDIVVQGELHRMVEQFKGDLTRLGHTFEGYLKQSEKTEEDIRKGWEKDAEKRALTQLILQKIAKEEKIGVDADTVEKEVKHVKEHHKDADEDRARIYIESLMVNEKVLEFLESL